MRRNFWKIIIEKKDKKSNRMELAKITNCKKIKSENKILLPHQLKSLNRLSLLLETAPNKHKNLNLTGLIISKDSSILFLTWVL